MLRSLLLVSGCMYGGGQRVVLDLLEESQNSTSIVAELCLLGGPVPTMPPVSAQVVEYDGRYNRPMTLLKTAGRLRKVVKRLKPNIIHSHGWDAAIIGALALVGLPIPHLIHIHTTDVWLEARQLKHHMRRALTRWMFNRPATTIVGVSDAVRGHWCRNLNWPVESFRVVRNGIDTKRFQPMNGTAWSNRALRIGVAARLQPNKGLGDLLGALKILAQGNLHPQLLIAGSEGSREPLESHAKELGLREQVQFLGFVQNMGEFYRGIDVAVLPSLSGEGLPLFVLEAMSCGLPVVATDVGGTNEVLGDGIDGFVVPPHEPSRLADALRKLLQDPKRRAEMGINARQRIEADFSSTVFFKNISELYREITAKTF